MTDTLTKLRAALEALEAFWLRGDSAAIIANPAIAGLRSVIAEMESAEPLYTHQQPKAEPAETGNSVSETACKTEPQKPAGYVLNAPDLTGSVVREKGYYGQHEVPVYLAPHRLGG